MTDMELLITVAICALVTAFLRFAPFILFSKKQSLPPFIVWIGKQLPRAVMAMLVVYCLKDVSFDAAASCVPAFLGVIVTATLHVWRRHMMLSIAGGTVAYMLLIRIIV